METGQEMRVETIICDYCKENIEDKGYLTLKWNVDSKTRAEFCNETCLIGCINDDEENIRKTLFNPSFSISDKELRPEVIQYYNHILNIKNDSQ